MKARGPTTQRILLVSIEIKTGTKIRKVEKGRDTKERARSSGKGRGR